VLEIITNIYIYIYIYWDNYKVLSLRFDLLMVNNFLELRPQTKVRALFNLCGMDAFTVLKKSS
jgi:hypothetical protein